ncbi:MAG: CCA tRNA nucleotidyltransferase [Planctomycetota bacterium]|jgi:hypothetical protein
MTDDRPARTQPTLRDAATHVARVLREAGFEAYFAGGCVRDRVMGGEPTDYDVVTDAVPEKITALFRRTHSVGEAFGVVLVRHGGHVLEVATFRSDGSYSDGRHPDAVTFTDARTDAQRRDFTINGLFEDPFTGEIIDYVGGQADIEARLIRAIGNAADRLHEDRLRMLRAVRFAARFGFAIETDTAEAIRRGAGDLEGISRERIGQELKKMLSHANRGVAAWELEYLSLDAAVLEERSLKVAPTRVGRLPDVIEYPTALAAWLLDRHGEDALDRDRIVMRWSECLMLSNAERNGLWAALEVFRILRSDWPRLGVARQKRLAASDAFQAGLALLQATDRQDFVDVRRRVLELSETDLAPTPLIDGTDLIAIGLRPGPVFQRVLAAVYDAQLEGSVSDADQALQLARLVAAESA